MTVATKQPFPKSAVAGKAINQCFMRTVTVILSFLALSAGLFPEKTMANTLPAANFPGKRKLTGSEIHHLISSRVVNFRASGLPVAEQFFADGNWTRIETMRWLRTTQGSWRVNGDQLCVMTQIKEECRDVWIARDHRTILMQERLSGPLMAVAISPIDKK